jgi:hypothetical protein
MPMAQNVHIRAFWNFISPGRAYLKKVLWFVEILEGGKHIIAENLKIINNINSIMLTTL